MQKLKIEIQKEKGGIHGEKKRVGLGGEVKSDAHILLVVDRVVLMRNLVTFKSIQIHCCSQAAPI